LKLLALFLNLLGLSQSAEDLGTAIAYHPIRPTNPGISLMA